MRLEGQNISAKFTKFLENATYFGTFVWNHLIQLEPYILPLDDLVIGNLESYGIYLQRIFMIFIYKFALVFNCLSYFSINDIGLVGRIFFCLQFIYLIAKIYWFLPNRPLATIKFWGLIDCIFAFLLNIYINMHERSAYNLTNICLIIAFCYYHSSITAKCILCAIIAYISMFVPCMREANETYIEAAIFMISYWYLFGMGQSHNAVIDSFSKKLSESKKSAENEVCNKNMFVASISHDLKNPLNSLLGCLDLIKNSPNLSTSDKSHLLTASYSGQILHYLIGNILDISKIEAGKFDIDRLPMDIMEEVKKIIKIEEELSKKKSINLYLKILTPIPKLVYGDAMRFAQVILNLIGNSIKFTSKGYVALVLSWANSIDDAKIMSPNVDEESLIPKEDFFIENKLQVKKVDSEENIKEEVTDPVYLKIAKYNEKLPSIGGMKYPKIMMTTGSVPTLTQFGIKIPTRRSHFADQIEKCVRKLTNPGNDIPEFIEKEPKKTETDNKFVDKTSKQFSDSGLLIMNVIDTGIGLTSDEQQKLFKPFNQANSSVKGKYGGTGLGLWITKQLVYLMSGFIELRSTRYIGTRFTITLPFKIIKSDDSLTPKSGEENKGSQKSSRRNSSKNVKLSETQILSARTPLELREMKRMFFKGANKVLKRMPVLLIENETTKNDSYIEQIINQLKCTDCKLSYTSYTNCLQILKERDYKFEAIIVIAAISIPFTMKFVTGIMKSIKDADYKQIPISIAIGIFYFCEIKKDQTLHGELNDLAKIYQLTFPLKDGDVINTLNKMRGQSA